MLKVFPSVRRLGEFLSSSKEPGTIVYSENAGKFDGEGDIEALFKEIAGSKDRVSTVTFSEYVDSWPPSGRIFTKESYNRDFLINDPEANYLHKKMYYVSNKIDSLRRAHVIGPRDESRSAILDNAERQLWMGEGDPLSLDKTVETRAREALFGHLIEAENLIDLLNRKEGYADLSVTDYDKDGNNEVLLSTQLLNIYISPTYGGSIFELDYKPKMRNLIRSLSFVDHLFTDDESGESFASKKTTKEEPCGFLPLKNPNEASVKLSREVEPSGARIKLTKTISVFAGQSIVNIYYELENLSDAAAAINFGIKLDLAVNGGSPEAQVFVDSGIKIIDAGNGFSVSLDLSGVSEILKDFSDTVKVFPIWKVNIGPGSVWRKRVSLLIEQ
jgi:hypothetical protein